MKFRGARTLVGVVVLAVFLLVGFGMVAAWPVLAQSYPALATGIGVLGGVLAAKGAVGDLADGRGVQGAKSVLMTEARPGSAKAYSTGGDEEAL